MSYGYNFFFLNYLKKQATSMSRLEALAINWVVSCRKGYASIDSTKTSVVSVKIILRVMHYLLLIVIIQDTWLKIFPYSITLMEAIIRFENKTYSSTSNIHLGNILNCKCPSMFVD